MGNTYDVGNLVRLIGTFTDVNGNPTDPTSITLNVRSPDNSLQTFTYNSSAMVRDSVGTYHYDFLGSEAGSYFYRFNGTGGLVAAGDNGFYMNPSPATDSGPC